MERLTKALDLINALGQLALTLLLLRAAWELLQVFTWTGGAL